MAAEIIEVPVGASLAGIRRRLSAVREGQVLLVLPDGWDGLTNPVRLQLLRRQADQQRIQLGLITRNYATKTLARKVGLPVFGTVEQALGADDWHYPPPPSDGLPSPPPQLEALIHQVQHHQGLRRHNIRLIEAESRRGPAPVWLQAMGLSALLIGLIVLVIALALLLVPVAEVHIVPGQEPVAVTVTLQADPQFERADAESGLVPARRVAVRVERRGQVTTTGRRDAPDAPASGVVVFVNRSSSPVEIPIGTIVATSSGVSVRFRTTVTATLPGTLEASVEVPVEALDPGLAGNVRPFTINRVEGSLAVTVRVINDQPTEGGTVKQVSVVTAADKQRLRDQTLQQARQAAYQALGGELHQGEFVPPETVQTFVESEIYDHLVDEVADVLSVQMHLVVRGIAVDGLAAQELARQALTRQLPRDGRLLADTVRYTFDTGKVSGETVDFSVTAAGQIVGDLDTSRMRASLVGLSPQAAAELLKRGWRLQGDPEIVLRPDWLGHLPWIPFRIQIRVDWEGT